jgi:ubiquinone/menaquinone biosynthesis C-methylase UbiE
MTKDHPHSITRTWGKTWGNRHDYLPAAGHDLLLPGYDLLTRLMGMRPAYGALVAQAGLFDGANVLEIGCGTGNLTMAAKRATPGAELTGVDPDPRALARARRKARGLAGIRFEQTYAQDLPYPDGSFDRVLSSMMLHHLDPDPKAAAVAEAFRVLRPGGSMHVVDIVGHHGAVVQEADAIPELLRSSGFQSAELGSRRLRLVAPVNFYRGIRPL